jgi:branched-chain amino acid transport system substrate-binding protein
MPQVSPTASHPDYSKISKYQFRITNTQKLLAPIHADMLAKRLGMKKIAILYFQDDWGIFVNNSTAEKLKEAGAQVILQEAMIPEARDFRALVTKVKAAEPDGIFLASHYVESGVFMRQLRQAGIKLTVAATDTLNNPKFIELAGDAANGVVMPTPFLPDSPAAKDFTKAYNARWNRMPDYYSAFSHDAIVVIGAAMKKLITNGKSLTRETVRDTLANLEPQQGVSGIIKFDAQGDPLDRKMEMLIVKDGAYHPF